MKEVFVHLDRCMGCRSCQLACATEHSASKNLFQAVTETPQPRYRLYVERADGKNLPITCRHCDPAPCLEACIAGALSRDDKGAVIHQESRCIGCWSCLMVCPYGVVGRKQEERLAVKCDRCRDRDVPACVSACPTKALVYADPEEFASKVRKVQAGIIVGAMAQHT